MIIYKLKLFIYTPIDKKQSCFYPSKTRFDRQSNDRNQIMLKIILLFDVVF